MRRPPKATRSAVTLLFASFLLSIAVPALAVPPGNGKLQIIHLNAAQGNAAVLISPEGEVAMFDDGSNTTFCTNCPSCASVLSQLQALGVTNVKLHFASHYHGDHIGCITALPGITIQQGWDRGGSYTTATYTNYVNYLGAKRRTLTKGQIFMLDSLSAHPVIIKCVALNGDGVATTDENSLSVVMKVTYGEFDEEIGGDLEGQNSGSNRDIETGVGPQVGKVEVTLVHHHASAYSTNENWLNAIQPKIGIVTAGNGNSYIHPNPTTMARLHSHGVRTYWSQLGAGATPDPTWDKVANGPIRIVATWQPGGVDSIYAAAYADTFTNSGTAVDATAPSVAVVSPNGGESWPSGSAQSVTWNASDNVGVTSVDLDYSVHGSAGPWNTLQHGLANSGSYGWTVDATASDSVLVRLTAFDAALNQASDPSDNLFQVTQSPLSVGDGQLQFSLATPKPNPSGGRVAFHFSLAAAAQTRIDVLDVTGRRVWGTQQNWLEPGAHQLTWDGRDDRGRASLSGLYFVRLTSGGRSLAARFVHLN